MAKNTARPGFTGVPDGEPACLQAPPIDARDRRMLDDAIAQLKHGPGDSHDLFLAELVEAADLIRCFSLIGRAGSLRFRRQNFKDALAAHKAGRDGRGELTVVNRMLVDRMRKAEPTAPHDQLLQKAYQALKAEKGSRGDRPQDELDCGALKIKWAYELYCHQRASGVRGGDFVELVTAVAAVALREKRGDMHSICERALRGRIEQTESGSLIITPFRLVDQS